MNNLAITIILISVLALHCVAQSVAKPQLTVQPKSDYALVTDGKKLYYLPSEASEVEFAIDSDTGLILTLPVEFTTKRLEKGDRLQYQLENLVELKGRFDNYSPAGLIVTAEFTGREGRVFRPGYFEVKLVSAVVSFDKPLVVGMRNNIPIIAAPGKYRLAIDGQLKNIQAFEAFNFNIPPRVAEGGRIKAPRPDLLASSGLCESGMTMGLGFIAKYPAEFVCRGVGLLFVVFKVRNWTLPAGTNLVFAVNRIVATKLPGAPADIEALRQISR